MGVSLSLHDGLTQFDAIYMPARNLADKTRREYRRDILQLVNFLEQQDIIDWSQVGLHELDAYMAELDRRQLQPSTRNRAIVMLFLQTGLRLAEVTGLALTDIELPKRITREPTL